MPKRSKEKKYYAVIRGSYLTVPTIFSSWGDVHPLVTGSRGSKCRGFVTLAEAEAYMEDEGVEKYDCKITKGTGTTAPEKGRMAYYAVANGRQLGIHENYYGSGGAEPEVVESSGACHKRFRTLAQAEAFTADWEETYACMVKAKIKEELSHGYRPAKMKGLPVALTLKTGGGNDEDELTDGLGKLGVE